MVSEHEEDSSRPPVEVVICIDGAALSRLGPVVRHLCVGLVDLRAKVRVVTSSDLAAPLSVGPVQLHVHPELVWPMRRSRLRTIVDFLSPRPPAVVYAVSAGSFDVAARLAEEFDVDLVVQLNSVEDVDGLDRLHERRPFHAVAASQPLVEMLEQRTQAGPETITLVRPGIGRGLERNCFANPEKQASLICTSRLEARNSIDVVIEAVGMIRDRGHVLRTFLTGEGPHEATLRKLVQSRRLAHDVTFARSSADTVEILRHADLLIVPPGQHCVTAPPLEAMANGAAVICFDNGVTDFHNRGHTALVCASHTATALSEVLEQVLNDPSIARRIAEEARKYVRSDHSVSVMAELTMEIIRSLALRGQTFPLRS